MADLPAMDANSPVARCNLCKVVLNFDATVASCPQHGDNSCPLHSAKWQAIKELAVAALKR